jgi:1-acyl-sn-glycerol-3-phosphate acyltransferase
MSKQSQTLTENGFSHKTSGLGRSSAERDGVFRRAGESNSAFIRAFKAVGRVICKSYLRVHCEGVENVPDQGAFLIVINHLSGLDPFLIGTMIDRPIYCLAKVELYRGPILTWILNSLGYIPLDRSTVDISAMRIVLRLLRNGEAVGIAPEGTRSRTGEMLPFTHGATKLALHAQVPLLPVSIYGTRELMPPGAYYFKPGRVYIRVGKLFDLSESYGKRITPELLEGYTPIVYQQVAELFEQIRVRPLD